MTYRTVCNESTQTVRQNSQSQTLEQQEDFEPALQNSPYNVNYDDTQAIVFKGREHRPCPAKQSGNVPVWLSDIPDFNLTQGVAMDAYDVSQHCFGADIEYTSTVLPTGLSLSTAGILSGTPTNTGSADPRVTATNAGGASQSNVFEIDVAAP